MKSIIAAVITILITLGSYAASHMLKLTPMPLNAIEIYFLILIFLKIEEIETQIKVRGF